MQFSSQDGAVLHWMERQPDQLARYYTEAGLIDKTAALWGKAGLRRSSFERSYHNLPSCLASTAAISSGESFLPSLAGPIFEPLKPRGRFNG
jgi:hypothetical protein